MECSLTIVRNVMGYSLHFSLKILSEIDSAVLPEGSAVYRDLLGRQGLHFQLCPQRGQVHLSDSQGMHVPPTDLAPRAAEMGSVSSDTTTASIQMVQVSIYADRSSVSLGLSGFLASTQHRSVPCWQESGSSRPNGALASWQGVTVSTLTGIWFPENPGDT